MLQCWDVFYYYTDVAGSFLEMFMDSSFQAIYAGQYSLSSLMLYLSHFWIYEICHIIGGILVCCFTQQVGCQTLLDGGVFWFISVYYTDMFVCLMSINRHTQLYGTYYLSWHTYIGIWIKKMRQINPKFVFRIIISFSQQNNFSPLCVL